MTCMTVILILTSLVLSIISWIYHRINEHSLFQRLKIPFVPPNFISGSDRILRNKSTTPMAVFEKWKAKYGDVFGYYVGGRPFLFVSDLDLVKDILVRHGNVFTNRPKMPIKVKPVTETLVGLRDQRWKTIRGILSPTFSMKKMKLLIPIINKKVDTLIDIIEERNIFPWNRVYEGLTLDIISTTAFAMELDCQRLQNNELLLKEIRTFLKHAISLPVLLSLYFPYVGKVLSGIANYFSLSGKATEIIITYLKEVIKYRKGSQDQPLNHDVLQMMLNEMIHNQSGLTKSGKLPENSMTEEELIANSWVFLLAGFETTASALTYTSYLLMKNPSIQENLYQEIISKISNPKENVTYEDVTKLTYLDQVLSEALRLYPPVVTFVIREASSDITIGDLFIPKDMNVIVPIWQIHRDPEQWPDPETFDPERFSHEAKLNNKRHPMSYLPFGGGPRNCIGMRFAQLEAKLTLARVLANFRLEPCENTPEELRFTVPTVTINPVDDIIMRAVPRE